MPGVTGVQEEISRREGHTRSPGEGVQEKKLEKIRRVFFSAGGGTVSSERKLRRKRPSRVAGARIQGSKDLALTPAVLRTWGPCRGEMQYGVSGTEDMAVPFPWVIPPSLP